MKILSRSVIAMFLSDFAILAFSTIYTGCILDFPVLYIVLSTILVEIVGLVTMYLKGSYKIREFQPTFWNYYRVLEGVIFTNIPVGALLYFFVDKTTLLKFLGINILIIYLAFAVYRVCFHYYLVNIKKIKNILILGTDERAKIIADEIQSKYALKMKVVGFVKGQFTEEVVNDAKIPVFEEPESLKHIIKDNEVDIVVIAQPTELILTIPRGIKIFKMPEFYEMVTGKYYVDEKTVTELFYQYATHRSFLYDFSKRAYDIIAALIILIVTLPITAYIAIRVKMIDGASPFFTQTRVGQDGKKFECYKLRTMYVNDYVPKNAEMLNDGADRTIPFCKWIRKAKLDEIPQMVNILKGEMSIVGPRAEWEKFADVYKKDLPYYSGRMWVKTGWTGWAHINMQAAYSLDEERERLEYDLYYIKHRNVVWEIGILLKAVFLALGGRHQ